MIALDLDAPEAARASRLVAYALQPRARTSISEYASLLDEYRAAPSFLMLADEIAQGLCVRLVDLGEARLIALAIPGADGPAVTTDIGSSRKAATTNATRTLILGAILATLFPSRAEFIQARRVREEKQLTVAAVSETLRGANERLSQGSSLFRDEHKTAIEIVQSLRDIGDGERRLSSSQSGQIRAMLKELHVNTHLRRQGKQDEDRYVLSAGFYEVADTVMSNPNWSLLRDVLTGAAPDDATYDDATRETAARATAANASNDASNDAFEEI